MPERVFLIALTLLLSAFMLGCTGAVRPKEPDMIDLYVSGTEGYHTHRIPSIVCTPRGTLLAIAEGRVGKRNDHAENDLLVKRSKDNGETWGPMQIIVEDGVNALVDPSTVVIGETGRVIVLYARYPQGFHHNKVVPGYDKEPIVRHFIVHSDDEGATWSQSREITHSVKRSTTIGSNFTPGIGHQLRRGKNAGRLLVPLWQYDPKKDHFTVCAAISDDLGDSWFLSQNIPEGSKGQADEAQVVQLIDGSILLTSRSYRGNKVRKVSHSFDGGLTFAPLRDEPALIEPECQGSILRYTDPLDGYRSRILLVNPASQKQRENGTVRLSYDEGKTWPVTKTLYPGLYAYSCLVVLPDKSIGCLFERDDYQKITFARFTLDWLTDGKDRLTK